MKVEEGDAITLHYTARMEDGRVFDTSVEEKAREEGIYLEGKEYEPVTFEVGEESIIPGISREVLGMEEGEEKEITLEPGEVYGHNEDYPVEEVPKSLFEGHEISPQEGLELETDRGFAIVTRVGEEEVELQYFHPLAGQEITFWIRVESVVKS